MKKTKQNILIFSLLIITILIIILNSIMIATQYKIIQDKINIVIANIVGKLEKQYPDIDDSEINSILNMDQNEISLGTEILNKYGIDIQKESSIKELENQKFNILIINITSIIVIFIISFLLLKIYFNNKNKKIKEITQYIKAINQKNYNLKIDENTEDELSNLTNELYKITVMLKEQADISINDKKTLQRILEDISHQLKTPLTSISIMLDNIRENPNMEEETRQKFINEISGQIEWLNWLIISLLKLSKLDSDTATFVKKEINVKQLIENVIKNLSIPIDIKQQNIIINGDEAKFIGDYNWQLEAITNIVKNCIEHTGEKKNIFINFEENNFYTKIVIRDEGTGIDKQDIKHIFERFYKAKNSSENSVGIGLALAKSIIEKDNGYIMCTSKVGEGTTFEIKYMKD